MQIKKQANQCTSAREYKVAAAVQAQDTQESWAYMYGINSTLKIRNTNSH